MTVFWRYFNDSNKLCACHFFLAETNEINKFSSCLSENSPWAFVKLTKRIDFGNVSCVSTRWDNGEQEKLSPWDLEPIPDDGN